jgi:hypothetical protein
LHAVNKSAPKATYRIINSFQRSAFSVQLFAATHG